MEYEDMPALCNGIFETPWGWLALQVGERGVRRVAFARPDDPPLTGPWAETLQAYVAGRPIPLDMPVDLSPLPPFSRRVLEACRHIPFGTVMTYGEFAALLGTPQAARAVGQALARNPVPVVIPCHRVVGARGALTGFLGGLAWKEALLRHEGVTFPIR